MRLVVEISLYPLAEVYIEPIKDFIERLNHYEDLYVKTESTSTVIAGDNSHVMAVLQKEMQVTHEQVGQAIFVCKFLNGTHMELN
ncbi:YkoF family thiamine/hydroxymethylpyrimidine-binding protein [Glaciecola sp. SC05]|uniref:YkoF family thiamine/hydroxymethylpyrimidine-binding protein n=1 Tax=Glaciecola sp. SC05 TaxID=1987355 RepID=UPI0035279893